MAKKDILYLIKERTLLIDGAMGTQLIERGLQKGQCPELWNLERSDHIRKIHKNYLDAGADIIITNTFGGTSPKLAKFDLQDKMEEINRAGVEIAKSVCPENRYVAGDMGPVGLFLPPVGKASEEDFFNAYKEQARVLKEAGADLLIIETQYDIREAVQAVKAAKTTGLPVFAAMTFEKKKRGYFTIMGNRPEECMKALAVAGADVVGANCSLECDEYLELTGLMKKASPVPILVQPNAGQPEMVNGKPTYRQTPEQFALRLKPLIEAGADIVGSCCGSTPEFTREIRLIIK